MVGFSARRGRADRAARCSQVERPRRPLRARPRAAAGVAHARPRRARGGRPQRHGQDHAVQRDHRPRARRRAAFGSPARRSAACRRTRSPSAASATCRRAGACGRRCRSTSTFASRRASARGAVDPRARLPDVPAPGRAPGATAARSSPAASSRCSRSRARCCSIRRLLVMDEPTEGLAPVIVEQVADDAEAPRRGGEIAVLLIEQNLGRGHRRRRHRRRHGQRPHRALDAGRRARGRPRAAAAACSACGGADDEPATSRRCPRRRRRTRGTPSEVARLHRSPRRRRRRRASAAARGGPARANRARLHALERGRRAARAARPAGRGARRAVGARALARRRPPRRSPTAAARRACSSSRSPRAPARAAYVAGTFDTKGRELFFLRSCLDKLGVRTVTVDLATSGKPSPAMVHPREVARHHPRGERAVFTDDRGSAVTEMAAAFEHFVTRRRDLGGLISAGGSGGTALATPGDAPAARRRSQGDGVDRRVGRREALRRPVRHLHDVFGHRHRRHQPHLREGARQRRARACRHDRLRARRRTRRPTPSPAIGLTMFGLTTPCVQAVTKALEKRLGLPRLPRHRHRRPVDGEARRLGAARGRDRRHHHRDRRRDRGRRAHRRARSASTRSSARACPTSARAARSTW